METKAERQELKHLANIEEDLETIRENTVTPRRAFWNGILQGGGAVVGGIIAILLIGLALSFFVGIIPGFDRIAPYLQTAFNKFSR